MLAAVNEGFAAESSVPATGKCRATEPPEMKKGSSGAPWGSVEVLLDLFYAGQRPAPAAVARLDHVPDLVERLRRCIEFLADESGKAHTDNVARTFFRNVEDFSIDRDDVGLLRGLTTFGKTQLDLAKHFRRREFANVLEVAGIVRCLQANEIHFGIAYETIDIEIGRDKVGAARSRRKGGAK